MTLASTEQTASPNSLADRRGHARYRFSVPISVHTEDGRVIRAMTLEISESGLSAMLASPLKVGDSVRLEPVAAGAIAAKVRHNVGAIYGFEFLQITEEQINKLRDNCRRLQRYPPNRRGI
jgi:c-di-GMP-binding flagellar brake protein YcgR